MRRPISERMDWDEHPHKITHSVMLSTRVPKDLRKRLKRVALERNVTMAEIVDQAIVHELDRLETDTT